MPTAQPPAAPDPGLQALPPGAGLGLRDAQLRGWFQNATGELSRGFDVRPEDVVLDAGCGDGGNAAFCARLGAHVALADIDPGRVAAAGTASGTLAPAVSRPSSPTAIRSRCPTPTRRASSAPKSSSTSRTRAG